MINMNNLTNVSVDKTSIKNVSQEEISFKPLIRFKEFDNEWEPINLGDFLEFINTNSLSRSKLNFNQGLIKNIHYGDIHTKFPTLVDCSIEEIPFICPDVDISKFKKEQYCKNGDLIIADASEDYEDIGKAVELINVNEEIVSGLHTILARDKLNKTALGFKGYLFLNESLRKDIKIIANGVSVLGISKNKLAKLEVKLPSFEEQQKIVSFLSAIDKKIILMQKTLSLYQKTIDYNINEIYSNIKNYDEVKMKNIFKSYSSNLSINKLENNFGKYLLYGAEGVIKSIDFYEIDTKYITIIKDGAGVGRLNLCDSNTSALGTLQCLIPKENYDINFLYFYLKTLKFDKYISLINFRDNAYYINNPIYLYKSFF